MVKLCHFHENSKKMMENPRFSIEILENDDISGRFLDPSQKTLANLRSNHRANQKSFACLVFWRFEIFMAYNYSGKKFLGNFSEFPKSCVFFLRNRLFSDQNPLEIVIREISEKFLEISEISGQNIKNWKILL